jgi:hypothetical protein
MSKNFSKSVPLEETLLSAAFVMRCTLAEFEDVKSYITRLTRAKIVYQTVSADKLFICRENGHHERTTQD